MKEGAPQKSMFESDSNLPPKEIGSKVIVIRHEKLNLSKWKTYKVEKFLVFGKKNAAN